MNAGRHIILNRAPQLGADGWIHIVPKGELPNGDAGIIQVLDDAALDSILGNLQSEQDRLGERWPGLYAGREHFIYEDDQDSAALAWFKDFEKRADGIWARADGLTPIGRQAVDNAEYKFTSLVANKQDCEKLPGVSNGLPRYRVLRVDTIGFTNQANGKELLQPITNRLPQDQSAPAPARVTCVETDPIHLVRKVYSGIATIVANRLKRDPGGYDRAHAITAVQNHDLFAAPYEPPRTADNFGRLVNRLMNRTGLSGVAATSRSADEVALLCHRFAPEFSDQPTAVQWDVLWRAAEALAEAGVPVRLLNRAPEGVTEADWKAANSRAADVLDFLIEEKARPVDRGPLVTNPEQARGLFRHAIRRLMGDSIDPRMPGNLTQPQAFNWLKENEPIFWTMAMLSFPQSK